MLIYKNKKKDKLSSLSLGMASPPNLEISFRLFRDKLPNSPVHPFAFNNIIYENRTFFK